MPACHPSPLRFALPLLAAALTALPAAAKTVHKVKPKAHASKVDTTLAADSLAALMKEDTAWARIIAREKSLKYDTGSVSLGEDLAVAKLAPGYRFLDAEQTRMVRTEMWGNPPDDSPLGMILPPGATPLSKGHWAVIIRYNDEGYVKDDDAAKIDYDDLLKDMQESVREENKERKEAGYPTIELVGWAEKPHYDAVAKKLHWAKELSFDGDSAHTLNYNIRILGRKGVLVLNGIADLQDLEKVKEGVKPILAGVDFKDGNRYADYKEGTDKVAAYGIAGLVAGTVLAKAGFFKLLIAGLLAAKKFIIIGLVAVVAVARKFFGGKPAEQKEVKTEA